MRASAVSLEIREASLGANRVRDCVSLSAAGGECIALLGASGSGKTTLLPAICGFVGLSSGSIVVGGQDWPSGITTRWDRSDENGFPAFTSIIALVIASGESSPARTPITVAGLAPVGAPICKGARS